MLIKNSSHLDPVCYCTSWKEHYKRAYYKKYRNSSKTLCSNRACASKATEYVFVSSVYQSSYVPFVTKLCSTCSDNNYVKDIPSQMLIRIYSLKTCRQKNKSNEKVSRCILI